MALAEYTTATGLDSLASAADATAYGVGSQATGDGSTALGGSASVWNGNTGELERFATVASGQESTAIGTGANTRETALRADGSRGREIDLHGKAWEERWPTGGGR